MNIYVLLLFLLLHSYVLATSESNNNNKKLLDKENKLRDTEKVPSKTDDDADVIEFETSPIHIVPAPDLSDGSSPKRKGENGEANREQTPKSIQDMLQELEAAEQNAKEMSSAEKIGKQAWQLG